jgi:L-fuculose-phosphate aldolase
LALEVGVIGRPPTHRQIRLFQEIGRRLDQKGHIASNDGNLSLRDEDGSFLVTARGARKGHLQAAEIVRVDSGARLLHGDREASSEAGMHLAIYEACPRVHAVVHAHPPVATGFSVAREPMDACVLPEIILTLGSVPVAPYSTPGTPQVARELLPFLREHDVILLANHGAVACGPDLEEAYFRMERLEHTARILLAARLLGRTEVLVPSEVKCLLQTGPPRSSDDLPCRPAPETNDPPGDEGRKSGRDHEQARSGLVREDNPWGRLAALITEVLESRGLLSPRKEKR